MSSVPIQTPMRTRLRREQGLGLIELLIAMTILNVGLLALVAALGSGAVAIRRAGQVTTASVLADTQMELYRALSYPSIVLDTVAVAATDTVYKSDPVIAGDTSRLLVSTALCASLPDHCNPSRVVTGADRRPYRVDTYITAYTPSGGRPTKKVTVVVRNNENLSARPFTRRATVFDEATG